MQPPEAPSAWMRIVFPSPGFFLNDPRVIVHVNGWCAYHGSFKSGFDVRFPVVPGPHLVVVTLDTLVRREERYTVPAYAGHAVEVWLDYSRMWGSFTGTPRIGHVPLG
jgi:hypothetical protein